MESPTSFRIYSPESIGAAIRHYRRQAGLSQADLAREAGISREYLSRLENGQETEQLRRILRLLRKLGLRMSIQEADW
jgi:HTH-type transcriptional regulator/antitoxin HipB